LTDERTLVPVRVLSGDQSVLKGNSKIHMSELDRKVKNYVEKLGRSVPQPAPGRRDLDRRMETLLFADLFDSGVEYRVLVEAPGIRTEDLDIALAGQELQIEAAMKIDVFEGNPGLVPQEHARVKTLRCVPLPEQIMAEKAEASLNNGVLEIRVPKLTPTRTAKHRIIRYRRESA
jgi:HSP20 family protein